jgi:type IV secretory pathway protease TraF
MNLSQLSPIGYLLILIVLVACNQHSTTMLESQLIESQKLTYPTTDAQAHGEFGTSVAADGDFIVVGASGTKGVADFDGRGAAYLYKKTTTGNWRMIKKLVASDGGTLDRFGSSVAISGNTLVVGVPYDRINNNVNAGSVYVFERHHGGLNNWGQVKKLVDSEGRFSDYFGSSVGISGNTVVASSINAEYGRAAVSIFSRNQGGVNAWGRVKKIASPQNGNYKFGTSIAISNRILIVGAPYTYPLIPNPGVAWVFEQDQTNLSSWNMVKQLVSSDGQGNDYFGSAVSIDNDTVVIGTPYANDTHSGQGAAYLFERHQGGTNNWGQVKKLVASDGAYGDFLGMSVAVSGNTVVIGASHDDFGNGDFNQGSAYAFKRNSGGTNAWGQVRKLIASDRQKADFLGHAVTVEGNTVGVASAPDDVGTNINQGSVYLFNN